MAVIVAAIVIATVIVIVHVNGNATVIGSRYPITVAFPLCVNVPETAASVKLR